MKLARYLAISIFFLAPLGTGAQVGGVIETGETCSYFGENVPAKVTTFASDAEAETVVKQIIAASGLYPNFDVMAAGVPNAAAIVRGGRRLILYDQYFVRSLRETAGTPWAPISVMAHEIGHHLNGHTLDSSGSRPKVELEADYYSGFVLQRMGATITEARAAMDKFGDPKGSATHPAKYDRLAAIANGWTKACEGDPKCHQPAPAKTEPESPRQIFHFAMRSGQRQSPYLVVPRHYPTHERHMIELTLPPASTFLRLQQASHSDVTFVIEGPGGKIIGRLNEGETKEWKLGNHVYRLACTEIDNGAKGRLDWARFDVSVLEIRK